MRLISVLLASLISGSALAEPPMPFDVGGPYVLTDQHGHDRTEKSPDGSAQLLFFGYANCPNICSAALPTMANTVRTLEEDGVSVTPILITISPEQDSVETIGLPLIKLHPRFVGLTGEPEALQIAYDAFSVEFEPLFQDPEYGWIYAHGSFIYLLDGNGNVLTLFPPTLSTEQAAELVSRYLPPA